jgi:hypothetical protein
VLSIPGVQTDLHDVTLVEVLCEWGGQVVIVLQTAQGRLRLSARDFTSVVVPREMPWGRSVSVNQVRLLDSGGNQVRLEIEMQSGDTIAVAAQRIEAAG